VPQKLNQDGTFRALWGRRILKSEGGHLICEAWVASVCERHDLFAFAVQARQYVLETRGPGTKGARVSAGARRSQRSWPGRGQVVKKALKHAAAVKRATKKVLRQTRAEVRETEDHLKPRECSAGFTPTGAFC